MFDRYVMVDWSASSQPCTGKDSIWICITGAEGDTITANPPTRGTAEALLRRVLHRAVESDERVLVGFDFPYAYPRGFVEALGLSGAAWRALWERLSVEVVDDPATNKNNRFAAAASLNAELEHELFWGRPSALALAHLSPLKDRVVYRSDTHPTALAEWREVEKVLRSRALHPQPAWKLYGNGAVGSQTLTGVPVLSRLRDDPALADVSAVWPFETAVPDLAPGRPAVIHAEIWPSLTAVIPKHGQVKDEAQVIALATAYRDRDRDGTLAEAFSAGAEPAAGEEGWILGVNPPTAAVSTGLTAQGGAAQEIPRGRVPVEIRHTSQLDVVDDHPDEDQQTPVEPPSATDRLALLAVRLGVPLEPSAVPLPSGTMMYVDGASPDFSVLVAICDAPSPLDTTGEAKLCQHALKLIYLRRERPGARLKLAVTAAAVAGAIGSTWIGDALRSWGVEIVVLEPQSDMLPTRRPRSRRPRPSRPLAGDRSAYLDDAIVMAVGVDGRPGGWIAAMAIETLDVGSATHLQLFNDIAELIDWHADHQGSAVGITVPIGIPDAVGRRPCDHDARARLGARRESVFEIPDRELWGRTFEDARAIVLARRDADPDRKYQVASYQALSLVPRMAEIDQFTRLDLELEQWLLEVHPDVSFAEMAGRPLALKHSPDGARERLDLLRREFPDIDTQLATSPWPKKKAPQTVIFNAYAVLWSALRFTRGPGHYHQLGGGERDGHGILMRMIV